MNFLEYVEEAYLYASVDRFVISAPAVFGMMLYVMALFLVSIAIFGPVCWAYVLWLIIGGTACHMLTLALCAVLALRGGNSEE